MPTAPNADLLDRELSKAAHAGPISKATGVLTEIVNYGTQLFARANVSANAAYERLAQLDPHLPTNPVIGDFHMPVQFLYLHGLELVDAVQVMLAQAVVIPAHLQTRALFEAMIQLEWILRDDTARRAFAYQLFDVKERLRFYRSLDPATLEGKELLAARQADGSASGRPLRPVPDLDKRIASLERLLTKPGYRDAVAEYERMRHAGKKPSNWFALYGGPQKIQQLARQVGRPMQYEILYRHWSAAVHGAQVGRRIDTNGRIQRMRDTKALGEVVTHTVNLSLIIIQLFAHFYRPGEEESFGRWYVQHIRPVLGLEAPAVAPPPPAP